jgi:hypothetical protein
LIGATGRDPFMRSRSGHDHETARFTNAVGTVRSRRCKARLPAVSSWNLFDLLGALICPTLSFTGLLGATDHAMRWSRGPIFVRANLADTERTIIPIRAEPIAA